jgi:cell division protein ZapE
MSARDSVQTHSVVASDGIEDGGPVQQHYRAALQRRGFVPDTAQLAAVARLDQLAQELAKFAQARRGTLRRLLNHPDVPRGVWLWGGVGRGKSFVMDCFFETVAITRKERVHFHEFMRSIHRELEKLKSQADPLDAVAALTAKRARLICFDEFHLSDIADAMILERLVRGLLKHGVCLVTTSNYSPDMLYPDGLHRDRVLPAIGLLKENLDVLSVDGGQDYRQRSLANSSLFHVPANQNATVQLDAQFTALAERADEDPVMTIEHRQISARRRAGGVIWFDFETLCNGPRSQNDYLELAQRFHTVFLSDIPKMNAAMSSPARRFTWLIDILYDQKVKLIASAQAAPDQLYLAGTLAGEFTRTASRLIEMQSQDYLCAPRRH